ncbi:hypothetical protein SASPL_131073 [Salvia splendens]|uniref:Nodulin homeobox N-terminal domain-containing protein n=1 Tax=Salvia splendens TaxID=180675 RepID=A0A8X8X752_SALSN|nr:hypothetical protein SASPL_131073 [Salvia splendens]
MNLKLSGSDNISSYMAAISRLKSKALSILLQLCEAESVSYLDEVASNTTTHNMAKSVGLEVLALLVKAWYRFKTVICSLRGNRQHIVFGIMMMRKLKFIVLINDMIASAQQVQYWLQSLRQVSPVERFLEKPNNRSSSRGSSLGRSPVRYDSSSRNMLPSNKSTHSGWAGCSNLVISEAKQQSMIFYIQGVVLVPRDC